MAKFDIFLGNQGNHAEAARRVDAAERFGTAITKMLRRAWESPGAYFIYCAKDRAVLATIDSTQGGMRGQQVSRQETI